MNLTREELESRGGFLLTMQLLDLITCRTYFNEHIKRKDYHDHSIMHNFRCFYESVHLDYLYTSSMEIIQCIEDFVNLFQLRGKIIDIQRIYKYIFLMYTYKISNLQSGKLGNVYIILGPYLFVVNKNF